MKKIEKNIERWAHDAVPDVLDQVMQQKGIENSPSLKKRARGFNLRWATPLLMIPLILLLVFTLSPSTDVEASSVYLDFDTALEIQVDDDDMIIEIIGENVSGQAFVAYLKGQTDWQGQSLDAYLETLFTEAKARGYIADESPVLVGTRASSDTRMNALKSHVIDRMQNLPEHARPFGDIFDHDMNPTSMQPDMMSGRFGMQRALLIDALIEANPDLDEARLEALSLGELIEEARQASIDIRTHPRMMP